MNRSSQNKRVYLDWAAATPLLPEVKAVMEPFLMGEFGNPSSVHQEGQAARLAVEEARSKVAQAFQVRPETVTFTGGGTEGNNLAILGSLAALEQTGRQYSDFEVVSTRIEHPSVIRTLGQLEKRGVSVKYVAVDEFGIINLDQLKELMTGKTVLVSIAYANSEIGTVQPVRAVRKVLRQAEESFGTRILLHVDAAQAPLWLNCQFDSTAADLLVLDAAKCRGPKGVGVMICGKRVEVLPVAFGGGQEQGLRPGTENVAGIIGAGVAFKAAQDNWRERAEQVVEVRDEGIKYLLENIPEAVLNGPTGENRLANNINISIPGLDTEYTTVVLDAKGFAVSTKSACSGAGGGESVVVKEISADPARASSTLRFSLGPETTVEQLKELTKILLTHIKKMSKL